MQRRRSRDRSKKPRNMVWSECKISIEEISMTTNEKLQRAKNENTLVTML